jgi:putative SOS response-associated peptidase YedK
VVLHAYARLMCGRYTNTAGVEELNDRFGIPITSEAGTRRFNIAPTDEVLAIVAPEGRAEARLLRWGLIPWWAKDRKSASKMINARVETVASTAAYSEPRQPFFFQVDGGAPFAFASLWTQAKIEGERIESVTLLTCDSASNRVAAPIHGRMPVILADRDAQRAWLDPALTTEDVLELCRALPTNRLSARAANPAVNKAGGEEGPELLDAPR